jgi:hypothetical protein
MGASSAAGRVLFGIFADKIGRLAAFKISVVLSALSVYFWLLCGDNFGMMAAFSVMYGVFGGSVLGLLTVAVAEVLGVVRVVKNASVAKRALPAFQIHRMSHLRLLCSFTTTRRSALGTACVWSIPPSAFPTCYPHLSAAGLQMQPVFIGQV